MKYMIFFYSILLYNIGKFTLTIYKCFYTVLKESQKTTIPKSYSHGNSMEIFLTYNINCTTIQSDVI